MKQRIAIAVLTLGIVTAGAVAVGDAGILEKNIGFRLSCEEFRLTRLEGYDFIKLDDSFSRGTPGHPLLPSRRMTIVLPQGAEILDVSVAGAVWIPVGGQYMLYPAQPPRPLSEDRRQFTGPDEAVYSMADPVPAHPIRSVKSGNAGGFSLAGLSVTPFRYWPREAKIAYLSSADITITYVISGPPAVPRSSYQVDETVRALRTIMTNPQDLDVSAPPVTASRSMGTGGTGALGAPYEYRHVIITSTALSGFVEPLSEWRTKHGYPSMVKTVEDIVNAYPGWDDAERVRNFIIDANSRWGTLYFTLAGDIGVVPMRYVGDPLGGPTASFPCDLYFSDLDGSWDADGDHIYGEEEDSIDLYSDVYVGRASIETATEANTFVTKTLTYEKSPPAGYTENCLLPGVQLWADYWGAFVNDSIAAVTPTPPWNDIKLYERYGTISRQGVIDAINAGVGYCHYSAHGNENGVYFAGGDTVLHSTDALALVNVDMLGVHNSIACISGAFDGGEVLGDCFAEHLMNHPGGGAVACIMNSRVGLGTPPEMGPSEHLSLEFYHKAFDQGMHRAGIAHGTSKDAWAGTGDWAYDFCLAELNLFGDAALMLWTAEPQVQTVEHPPMVPTGPSSFTVTVRSSASPLEGALVCIMTPGEEVYHFGETDGAGEITFEINPAEEDTLHVTSTAPNRLPYEGITLIEGGSSGITDAGTGGPENAFFLTGNPVTGNATFRFGLKEAGRVNIKVFDVSGRLVDNVADRDFDPGTYRIRWNTAASEKQIGPGVYLATFTTAGYSATRRIVLLR